MSKKVSTMINVFDSIFKDYSWFNDQEQYEIHLGRFSRGFMSAYNELQSAITAQEDIIKRLKEDAERLATRYEYFDSRVHRSSSYCRYCGHLIQIKSHADNCPITLHTQLMNELGEK